MNAKGVALAAGAGVAVLAAMLLVRGSSGSARGDRAPASTLAAKEGLECTERAAPSPGPAAAPPLPVAPPPGAAPTAPGEGRSPATEATLPKEVLRRAKSATVFVQVKSVSYVDEQDEQEASGSGFLLGSDGVVATNWHVIEGRREGGQGSMPLRCERIEVLLRPGTPAQALLPARLLAADPKRDLALLKIEAEGEQGLELGDSDRLEETAALWVCGFPLGRVFSVLQRGPEISISHGRVTSLRHDDRNELDRIQFDAIVNPGNSGGPVMLSDGRVVAVANMALGTSRLNFGVPARKLKELLAESQPEKMKARECRFSVGATRAGAEVYLDGRRLGRAPFQGQGPTGYGRLVVTAPGWSTWSKRLAVYDGLRLEAAQKELKPQELKPVPADAQPPSASPAARGPELWKEDFAQPRAIDSWEQETGGNEQRTWYVEGGELHQYSDDGLLHSLITGNKDWGDYAFSAKVRIQANRRDGRAGLIFRADEDGFALFRLHRGAGKVQLAYHMHDPFGWQVLAERRLDFAVEGGKWYEMQVQVRGARVLGLIDGAVVLEASLPRAGQGRVGFYSVDSRADFSAAKVTRLADAAAPAAGRATLQSFWFSESFEKEPAYWRARRLDEEQKPGAAGVPPWPLVAGGCAQFDAGGTEHLNLLERFNIVDAQCQGMVSSRSGTVGLVFRARTPEGGQPSFYLFAVTMKREKAHASLVLVDGEKRKTLATAGEDELSRALMVMPPFEEPPGEGEGEPRRSSARPCVLFVIAQGDRLQAGVNNRRLIEAEDATLKSGFVGFYSRGGKALFLQLHAAGPVQEQP